MFSEFLFTHKYDIDDLLLALCGPAPTYLNTQTGEFSAAKPSAPAKHTFLLEPLPPLFIQELINSPETTHLSEAGKHEVQTLLQTATVQQLPSLFENGHPGGWIRERVKDAALEWLDAHDLIPPSMRHINRKKTSRTTTSRNVQIEDLD